MVVRITVKTNSLLCTIFSQFFCSQIGSHYNTFIVMTLSQLLLVIIHYNQAFLTWLYLKNRSTFAIWSRKIPEWIPLIKINLVPYISGPLHFDAKWNDYFRPQITVWAISHLDAQTNDLHRLTSFFSVSWSQFYKGNFVLKKRRNYS